MINDNRSTHGQPTGCGIAWWAEPILIPQSSYVCMHAKFHVSRFENLSCVGRYFHCNFHTDEFHPHSPPALQLLKNKQTNSWGMGRGGGGKHCGQ